MAGSKNGYLSLDALRAVRRLEEDVEIAGVGKFRVQALTHEELRLIARRARDNDTGVVKETPSGKETSPGQDGYVYNQATTAYGLVQPPVAETAATDLDEAMLLVQPLAPIVVAELATKITALTFRRPGDAFTDFSGGDASPTAEAVSVSGTSS